MKPRWHRQNLVVWKSSARPARRSGAPRFPRPARTSRIRRRIRTGAQLAVIGLMRLARAVRTRRGARLLLAGAVLTVAGPLLPDGLPGAVAFVAGIVVLLRGVAVSLGVPQARRRFDGGPAAEADYFGFGSLPSSEPRDRTARMVTGRS